MYNVLFMLLKSVSSLNGKEIDDKLMQQSERHTNTLSSLLSYPDLEQNSLAYSQDSSRKHLTHLRIFFKMPFIQALYANLTLSLTFSLALTSQHPKCRVNPNHVITALISCRRKAFLSDSLRGLLGNFS